MFDYNLCKYCSYVGTYGHLRCSKDKKYKIDRMGDKYCTSKRCWWLRRIFCGYKR